MKLSISNIAWTSEKDSAVYELMKKYEYSALEIAPTRIFPINPYEDLKKVKAWWETFYKDAGFTISSMQSIWYGRNEKLFSTMEERNSLVNYTKKAIDFATTISCGNLVFGCPKNRYFPEQANWQEGVAFFREIGDYAYSKGTVIGMEANPAIYGTNYINDTASAIDLIKTVNSKGFLLNLDVGTMVANEESISTIKQEVRLINHVHISEPHLKVLEKRTLHKNLAKLLKEEGYEGYISIEMGCQEEVHKIEKCLCYVKEVFKDGI